MPFFQRPLSKDLNNKDQLLSRYESPLSFAAFLEKGYYLPPPSGVSGVYGHWIVCVWEPV